MSVKERLKEYIKHKGISTRAFCRSINVSETYVASMRESIQPAKLNSIANQYSDLNTGWLMTGEGTMLKEDQDSKTSLPDRSDKDLSPEEEIQALKEEIYQLQKKIIGLQDEQSRECARLLKIIIDLQQQLLKSKGEVGGGKNGPVRSGFAETG